MAVSDEMDMLYSISSQLEFKYLIVSFHSHLHVPEDPGHVLKVQYAATNTQ